MTLDDVNERMIISQVLVDVGFSIRTNDGGNHAYEVKSPYVFSDGDGIRFYLMFPEEGKFTLRDGGSCLFHLSSMSFKDYDYERLESYSDLMLDGILKDGELVIRGEIGWLADAVMDMNTAFLILEMKFKEWGWMM